MLKLTSDPEHHFMLVLYNITHGQSNFLTLRQFGEDLNGKRYCYLYDNVILHLYSDTQSYINRIYCVLSVH